MDIYAHTHTHDYTHPPTNPHTHTHSKREGGSKRERGTADSRISSAVGIFEFVSEGLHI